MKIKLKRLYQACVAYRHSDNLGDFALLKADAFGVKTDPAIAAKMEGVTNYYPPIELSKLIQLPPGTFGYEYALYMQTNKLRPLNVSAELREIGQNNLFALRYAVTHDMFHVLLNFNTDYAGEIGVLAFAVAQKYSRLQANSLLLAQFFYPLLAPRQFRAILANLRRGKRMGQQANFLLNYRFEDRWQESLDTLRQELNIKLDLESNLGSF